MQKDFYAPTSIRTFLSQVRKLYKRQKAWGGRRKADPHVNEHSGHYLETIYIVHPSQQEDFRDLETFDD